MHHNRGTYLEPWYAPLKVVIGVLVVMSAGVFFSCWLQEHEERERNDPKNCKSNVFLMEPGRSLNDLCSLRCNNSSNRCMLDERTLLVHCTCEQGEK